MTQQHANPFVHINHWVKGEVWCLEALNEAVAQRDAIDGRKRDAEKEIVSLTETINKLNANKFTFGSMKSMFSSEAAKKEDALKKETVRSELQKDVSLFDVLKKYLTIYLATVAIPNYKKQRIESYIRAMGRMSDAEVRNAENTYDCWNNFQKTIVSYNIKYWGVWKDWLQSVPQVLKRESSDFFVGVADAKSLRKHRRFQNIWLAMLLKRLQVWVKMRKSVI